MAGSCRDGKRHDDLHSSVYLRTLVAARGLPVKLVAGGRGRFRVNRAASPRRVAQSPTGAASP